MDHQRGESSEKGSRGWRVARCCVKYWASDELIYMNKSSYLRRGLPMSWPCKPAGVSGENHHRRQEEAQEESLVPSVCAGWQDELLNRFLDWTVMLEK